MRNTGVALHLGLVALWVLWIAALSPADAGENIAKPDPLRSIVNQADADRFWKVQRGKLPLVDYSASRPDRMTVTFLWRAPASAKVAFSAGFLIDEGRRSIPLETIPGTDLHYLVRELPADARFAYYFVLPSGGRPAENAVSHEVSRDGAIDYVADPNARQTFAQMGEDGRVKTLSWFSGPAADPQRGLFGAKASGQWIDYRLPSKVLAEERPFSVYIPKAAAHSARPPAALVIFDRELYRLSGMLPSMLDALIASGRIPPMIAIMVSPIDDVHRVRDLAPNDAFQDFLADELMPYVRQRHRISSDPQDVVVAGSSFGGLAAMYTGLRHPESFGKVISQSGSFWWYPDCCAERRGGNDKKDDDEPITIKAGPDADMGWLIERFAVLPKAPLRIDMNVGRWEGAQMLIPNRMMHHVLRAKAYNVRYEEYSGGHDIIQWRATLPGALERLFRQPQ